MVSPEIMSRRKQADAEDIPDLDIARARIVRRGPKNPLPRFSLRMVREGIGRTQEEVARTAQMDQGDVSRLEQRDDVKLSTLRRYLRALGGELDLVLTLRSGHRMRLDL
jgi:hypothetical protein